MQELEKLKQLLRERDEEITTLKRVVNELQSKLERRQPVALEAVPAASTDDIADPAPDAPEQTVHDAAPRKASARQHFKDDLQLHRQHQATHSKWKKRGSVPNALVKAPRLPLRKTSSCNQQQKPQRPSSASRSPTASQADGSGRQRLMPVRVEAKPKVLRQKRPSSARSSRKSPSPNASVPVVVLPDIMGRAVPRN